KLTRRIWWSMRENPSDSDNSVAYIFYLNYGVKPSGTFTTASNFNNFRPSSMVFKNGVLYMGHEKGYLLKTFKYAKTDVRVDTTVSPTLWRNLYIPYDWTSVAFDVGTIFKRKWMTKI